MTKFQEKAQGQVKQMVGQMIGDDRLVVEGKEQQHNADHEQDAAKSARDGNSGSKQKTRVSRKKSDDPTRKGPVLE